MVSITQGSNDRKPYKINVWNAKRKREDEPIKMTIIGTYCPLCPIVWDVFDEWVWGDGSSGIFPDIWDDDCLYKKKDKKDF